MLLVVLALLAWPVPPTVTAAPSGSVQIDGVFDEADWDAAEVATGFVQFEPSEGVPATDRTEVRVLTTADGLVVGARMWGDNVRAPLSRRDDPGDADRFLVAIDSYNDRRTAYAFGVTAAGVQFDATIEGDDDDDSWDAVWDSAVRVLPDGWAAEIRIPYSQLRFSDGVESWGVNFQRESPGTGEESFWAPVTRAEAQGGLVRLFGRLDGLAGIRPRPVLQAIPYTLAGGSRRESEAVPGAGDAGFEGNVGADLKVGLSSNVTLDATVNPDFGQVEADPAQLNLGTFEVIFQERRPFFTEGTQIFDLTVGGGRDGALLYTRRIGSASPIVAATKLTGRTPGGLSFGVLGAATGSNFSPDRGYVAGRVKQEFPGQSYVGGGVTTFLAGADYDGDPDGAAPLALAGAADGAVRFADGTWLFEGTAAGTVRTEGEARDVGGALYLGLDKVQGFFLPGFGLRAYSAGFSLNDVGRFRQTDVLQIRGGARHLWNEGRPLGPIRRLNSGGFLTQTFTLADGANQGLRVFAFNGIDLQSFEEIDLNVEVGGLGGVDVLETRGLGPVRNLVSVGARVSFESDSRRRFRWEAGLRGGGDQGGGVRYGVGGGLSWTASDRVTLQLDGGVGGGDGVRAWASNESLFETSTGLSVGALADVPEAFDTDGLVGLDAPVGLLDGLTPYDAPLAVDGRAFYVPLLAARDTREVDLTARGQIIFAPDLSLQLYGQLFAARGRFRDFGLLAGPDDLRPLPDFPKRRDFSLASFNANAVLRWQYRPGSVLFVVWSQGREDSLFEETLLRDAGRSPFDAGTTDSLGGAFDAFPSDLVLVKLSYLLMR